MDKPGFKRLLLACCTALMILFVGQGHASSETGSPITAPQIQRPLLVGIIESPLMGFKDSNNELKGFEAELALLICEKIQRQCELYLQSFAKNVADVQQGQLDMALSSILVNEQRKQSLLFSTRYMRSVSHYIGNPDTQPKYRPLKVAVLKGSVHEHYLRQVHSGHIETVTFNDIQPLYQALKEGQVDRVLAPALLQLSFLHQDTSAFFDIIDTPLTDPKLSGDVAVALAPDNSSLKHQVDKAIQLILTDGSYNRLNNQYFPFNVY